MSDRKDGDDHRSTQDGKIELGIANSRGTDNNDDKRLPSFAVHENGLIRTPTPVQAASSTVTEDFSIYNVRTRLKCKVILAVVSLVGVLLSLCDTIYLPALNAVQKDLNTTEILVGITVSIYLFMNGLCSVVWGSISDRFGRRITLLVALTSFLAVTIACIFVPNIAALIVFRVFQGAAISASLVVGQGCVSDIYPAQERGWATGIFFVPVLVGPVIGPLIGGVLSEKLTWRSTFVLLSILSFIILILVFFLVPETHHYFAKEHFEKANPNKRIVDASINEKPPFSKPWKPLTFLADLTILPYIVMATTTFAALFISFVVFPLELDEPPYNYTETVIGFLFVPAGVSMFIGCLLGGRLSDMTSRYYDEKNYPESRLLPAAIFSILVPIGLIIYGWTFQHQVSVAGPIIGLVTLGLGRATVQPCIFAYLTIKKRKEASGASSANTILNFCAAGIGVTVAVPLNDAIGIGPFFTLLCGINIITIGVMNILIYKRIRKAKRIVIQENNSIVHPEKPDDGPTPSINKQTV